MECFINQLTLVTIHLHLEQLRISGQKITPKQRNANIIFEEQIDSTAKF